MEPEQTHFGLLLGLAYFVVRIQFLYRGGVFQRYMQVFLLAALVLLEYQASLMLIAVGGLPHGGYVDDVLLTAGLVLLFYEAYLHYAA